MALPKFTKSGLSDLVFTRGNIFPSSEERRPRQIVKITESGKVKVATLSANERLIALRFERLPAGDFTLLKAWFTDDLINWSANTFTFTDADAVAETVRWMDDSFRMPEVSHDLYNVDLRLRVEIT